MSATVNKALSLLGLFSETTPELGLTDIGRLAGIDKATAHRLLTSLAAFNLLEQHPETRHYRLGAAVLRLARIREAAFPVMAVVQPFLDQLAEETGETAHASLYSNQGFTPVGAAESKRSNRVSVPIAELLPVHATASGLAFLAFSGEAVVTKALSGKLKSFTAKTITSRDQLLRMAEAARRLGFAVADQTYEDEVYGIAAPIFGPSGDAIGAVAVATPSHRLTRELKTLIIKAVMEAGLGISRKLGNEPPPSYIRLCLRKAA